MFNDKFSGSIDYFHEQRNGIYMVRSYLPQIIGLNHITTKPYANVGSVLSEGFDGNIAYKQRIGEDVYKRQSHTGRCVSTYCPGFSGSFGVGKSA